MEVRCEEETAHGERARHAPPPAHLEPGHGPGGPDSGHPVRARQPLDLHRRRPGLLHAGRVRARRGRPDPVQERLQHHDEEPDGHVGGRARLRARRVRHRVRR